ncbi:ABC transporter substrate-binding protein [Qaidamihabitans albus]|uniref:ABC transporter substrate-binding protein n=1 Tax=Qaidamihabitans albus TaxID=2795733 RepID=UPI0018F11FE6|nr:ABC transporter substrate-binding protein [Qaidamihabitans albus]
MTKHRLSLATLAVAALLGAACSPVGQDGGGGTEDPRTGQARKGGDLVVALSEEPDRLDPSLARTFVGRIVFSSICEKLYDVDENLEVVPQLAADLPDVSDDGLTVRIPVREGITFNDGTNFDAEAVKRSLDRHREISGSARASEIAPIEEVRVVDDTTVEIGLSEPFAPLTAALADRAGMIMSPAQLDKLGENFADEPVCVGPFSFAERKAQDRIVVTKSEHYYDAGKVNLDRVVYRTIAEPNVRLSNLRSGDIHVAEDVAPTDVATIQNDANFQVVETTSIGYQGITVNIGNGDGVGPPFTKPGTPLASEEKLREAFELSLDRDALNKIVFDGRHTPGCTPLSPASPWAVEGFECTPHDVEAAKRLVRESGIPTPIPVELITANNAEEVRVGEVIQSMAKEAGFAVTVRPTEFAAALDEAEAGNFDTFRIGWSGRIDADQNVHQFQHSSGSLNWAGTNDADIDRLLDEARAAQSTEERKELYRQAVERASEVRGIIYLYHENLFLGAAQEIVGLEYFGDGLIRVTNAGFAAEQG